MRSPAPRSIAVVLLTALALLGPAGTAPAAPAGATVLVPQLSIRGVKIGMNADQVRRSQGRRPDSSKTLPHPVLQRTVRWTYGLLTVTFDGTKASRRVFSVSTTSRKDRTTTGVGVGSSEAAVRRGVDGVRCRTELGYRRCVLGTEKAGKIVTDFAISTTGRVARVGLARVID